MPTPKIEREDKQKYSDVGVQKGITEVEVNEEIDMNGTDQHAG